MTTLPRAQLANCSFVTPTLAVGGDVAIDDDRLALLQLAELVHLGITHVVDVRSEWSDAELFLHHAPEVRYLHHGMDDAGQRVRPEWFEHAVSWVEAAWERHEHAVVLTHCHMGINRGPSLGFAILLSLGWDPVDAIARSALPALRPTSGTPPMRSTGTSAGPASPTPSRLSSTPRSRPGGRSTRSTSSV